MKNFYSITESQFVVMWIFEVLIFLVLVISGSAFLGAMGLLTLFFVIFYTIGWKNHSKNKILAELKKDIIESKDKNSTFCSRCGQKNTLDSKYCIECGELIIN